MGRMSRIVLPGVPVHVTQRGNRRENIFRDDEDKAFYLKKFMFYRKLHRVKLYAWCLMDNHVHFVLEPKNKSSLHKLFLKLNTSYVQYFNKKYKISGKLFGSRFFSCVLDEPHFVECIRYVELNPFRAKLERSLAQYKWSSAPERLGIRTEYFLSKLPVYFSVSSHFEFLSEPIQGALESFSKIWQSIFKATRSGVPFGTKDFVKKIGHLFSIEFNEST